MVMGKGISVDTVYQQESSLQNEGHAVGSIEDKNRKVGQASYPEILKERQNFNFKLQEIGTIESFCVNIWSSTISIISLIVFINSKYTCEIMEMSETREREPIRRLLLELKGSIEMEEKVT